MFIELAQGHHPDQTLSIRSSIMLEPLLQVDRVVSYLRAGHDLIDMMDVERDPLDPSRTVTNGSSIQTDGDYLWRYDYAYYVKRHNVVVPDDFLTLIRARHYVVPERPYEQLAAAAEEAEKYAFGLNGGVRFSDVPGSPEIRE